VLEIYDNNVLYCKHSKRQLARSAGFFPRFPADFYVFYIIQDLVEPREEVAGKRN